MNKEKLLDILKGEMERSTGCTDPGAVALAVSIATGELGTLPERIEVAVSPSVFKNGVSVGIPGTGERGLAIAAAVGAALGAAQGRARGPGGNAGGGGATAAGTGESKDRGGGLAIFDRVTPGLLALAKGLVAAGAVRVDFAEAPDPLHIRASVTAGLKSAGAVIANDYSNIVEISRDGKIVFSTPLAKSTEVRDALAGHGLEELFGLVAGMKTEDLAFLLEAVEINMEAARKGLADPSLGLGRSLAQGISTLPMPFSAMRTAQAWTAAASEARMAGLPVTVVAIAGSGNHGITFSLGVLSVATGLGSSREDLARALAYAALVTVVIKSHVRRMTAFCGCAVAASTGVAAATVHLLGGDFAASERAMQSVIGTLAGMLCDGAKESCAWKLSTSAFLAIQSAYGAMQGTSIPSGMGIVGRDIDESFANLGLLNNPGMVATNELILRLIGRI